MLLQHFFAVHHEMLAAQHQKRLIQIANLGMGFFHHGAERFKAPHFARANFLGFPVHRNRAAEACGEGDALRCLGLGCRHRRHIGARRRFPGHRVGQIPACHAVQKQRQIRDIARHRPIHRKRRIEIIRRATTNAPRRRAQPHHGTIGRGAAQRPPMIRPMREPYLACRQGNRATPGGTTAGE